MSDDFDRLRQTMSELSEHGGSTDLYDRTLHTSRRITRRRNALAGGAVAAAVLALGVPVALAGWDRAAPPAPPAEASPTAPPPSPTAPSPSPSPSLSPSSPSTPPSSNPAKGTPSSSRPAATGCPVSATALSRVADLGEGWTIDPDSVKCSQGWAVGKPKPPSGGQGGDGVTLFRYSAGKWKEVTQGSALECAEYGVPKDVGRRIGACG